MSKGVRNVVYPVKDMARAKKQFRTLLGVEPYADTPAYVGFKAGELDISLDAHGHTAGVTVYYTVDDIKKSVQSLVDAGGQVLQDVKGVGGGMFTAIVRDAEGNIIGLAQ